MNQILSIFYFQSFRTNRRVQSSRGTKYCNQTGQPQYKYRSEKTSGSFRYVQIYGNYKKNLLFFPVNRA